MTPAELRALGRLGGQAAAGIASRTERVQEAVAGRVFGHIKEVGAPARLIHDTVARGVYLGVRSACEAAGAIGGEVMARFGSDEDPPSPPPRPSDFTLSNTALAALNAVAGDRLRAHTAPLAIRMAVRKAGRDVVPAKDELAGAFPQATSKLAVFVHGLAETEHFWFRAGRAPLGDQDAPHGDDETAPHGDDKTASHGGHQGASYGEELRARFGYTPVYVRYNTGRHISDNGRDLAGLLADVTAAWPVPVDELLLVGHSMGGLVIRSACHYGHEARSPWAGRVRHIFYLGSPHLGAPLARAAGFAGWALSRAAETRPFVTLVNGSSGGIKDLRHGYLVDDDWQDCDLDSCVRNHRGDTPLLPGADHHVISATVTADPGSPFGAVVGDLLVTPGSAHGRRRRRQLIPFQAALGHPFGGMHHLHLLNHPSIWAAMRDTLVAAVRTHGGEPAGP